MSRSMFFSFLFCENVYVRYEMSYFFRDVYTTVYMCCKRKYDIYKMCLTMLAKFECISTSVFYMSVIENNICLFTRSLYC